MIAHNRKSPKREGRSTSFDCNNAILRLKTIIMIMILTYIRRIKREPLFFSRNLVLHFRGMAADSEAAIRRIISVADPEGVQGVHSNPLPDPRC